MMMKIDGDGDDDGEQRTPEVDLFKPLSPHSPTSSASSLTMG
jgi:hypothetical protein